MKKAEMAVDVEHFKRERAAKRMDLYLSDLLRPEPFCELAGYAVPGLKERYELIIRALDGVQAQRLPVTEKADFPSPPLEAEDFRGIDLSGVATYAGCPQYTEWVRLRCVHGAAVRRWLDEPLDDVDVARAFDHDFKVSRKREREGEAAPSAVPTGRECKIVDVFAPAPTAFVVERITPSATPTTPRPEPLQRTPVEVLREAVERQTTKRVRKMVKESSSASEETRKDALRELGKLVRELVRKTDKSTRRVIRSRAPMLSVANMQTLRTMLDSAPMKEHEKELPAVERQLRKLEREAELREEEEEGDEREAGPEPS